MDQSSPGLELLNLRDLVVFGGQSRIFCGTLYPVCCCQISDGKDLSVPRFDG
jgi:hypothetical protein